VPALRIVALVMVIVSGWSVYHLAATPTISETDGAGVEPLFALSVKQAALPNDWPSGDHGVAHYRTMFDLLTMAAESSRRAAEAEPKAAAPPKSDSSRRVRRAKRQKPVDTEEDGSPLNAYARGDSEPRWRSQRDDFRNRREITEPQLERRGRDRSDRLPFFPFGGFEGR
jgi:hypothetical protein